MPAFVRFGPFELDLSTADLHRNGRKIRLPEQQFQILEMLLRGQGNLVSREEIRKRLWPNDTVVEFDRSINAAIKKLRGTLGDSADAPRFVETVARRGYRIMVEVQFPDGAPPADVVRKTLDGSLVGQRVSHYRVLTLLGGGGMGLVYKAEDLKLNRLVALKFLADELASDASAVQRFEREAKAASALNHPNICTIHSVEEHGNQPFIVMELLEGESLRELISRLDGRDGGGFLHLPPDRLLEIAVQVAEGLNAAHEKGIIHRDIKPANLFLTTGGRVKILDFGLAQVNTSEPHETGSIPPKPTASETPGHVPDEVVDLTLTRFGATMGTSGYMSPEQIRGEKLDSRTDLFSFGLTLFEMVTGQRAFVGETRVEVQTAILHTIPAPVRQLNRLAPVELERMISKCLEKDLSLRYQHASEVRDDLFRLKRKADSLGLLSTGTGASSDFSKSKFWIVVVLLIFAVGGIALSFSRYLRPTRLPFQKISIETLQPAATGAQTVTAISRDGRFVAYVMGPLTLANCYVGAHEKESLWMMQIAGTAVQIVPPDEVHYSGLAFSPYGDILYFVRCRKDSSSQFSTLYRMPAFGGRAERVIDDVEGAVTLSPDGKQLAFVRNSQKKPGNSKLIVANEDGSAEKVIAGENVNEGIEFPAWSPDGKTIAFSKRDQGGRRLTEVPIKAGHERFLSEGRWASVWGLAWLSDRRGLMVVGAAKVGEQPQIHCVSYVTGEVSRVTNDLNDYYGLSLTADSGLIAAVQEDFSSDIWIGTLANPNKAFRISSGGRAIQPVWTPDGGVAYVATEVSRSNLWRMQADGSNPNPLTIENLGNAEWPRISPDARYIAFSSNRTGGWHIWRADIDGNNPQQLTKGAHEGPTDTSFSPDGKWVIFANIENNEVPGIWRVPIGGGDPIMVTRGLASDPVVSPDGKKIAYLYWDEKAVPSRGVAIMAFEGGPPARRLDIPADGLAWTPGGRSLLYAKAENGVSNLWIQPLAGGASKQITHFDIGSVNGFDLSREGKRLVMDRYTESIHVVLIRDLR